MKTNFYPIALLCLLTVAVHGQSPAPSSSRLLGHPAATNEATQLTKFNLNFPGGTPHELVAAIEKASGRPLNVVIPDEYADEMIPPLRMKQVTAPDLFRAMELASIKTEPYRTSAFYGGMNSPQSYSYQQIKTSISFQTSGPVSDDSVWYFRGREKIPDLELLNSKQTPTKTSRFYALAPYLEQGLKVEDITTAVQTAWKMLGEKETPNISFHKETKLLIAVGEPRKLETIDAVLEALSRSMPPRALRPPLSPAPMSVTPPKTPDAPAKTEP